MLFSIWCLAGRLLVFPGDPPVARPLAPGTRVSLSLRTAVFLGHQFIVIQGFPYAPVPWLQQGRVHWCSENGDISVYGAFNYR